MFQTHHAVYNTSIAQT